MSLEHERKAVAILNQVRSHGGYVVESKLSYYDPLIVHRLLGQGFLKPVGIMTDTGEAVFSLTQKGDTEVKSQDN